MFAGYKTASSREDLVYRSESVPGLGFLLKRSVYEKNMQNVMEHCCNKRWVLSTLQSCPPLCQNLPGTCVLFQVEVERETLVGM